MARTSATPAPVENAEADATRTRILEAALECFQHLGIAKTNLHDVARVAQVSRGTVYRYFSERRALIDAAIEMRAEKYYATAAARMATRDTLAGQIGALGEVFAESINDMQHHRLGPDDSALMRLSAEDREGALQRMTHFLRPYLLEAKASGEVRADLDANEASEWIARVLMSITTLPASKAFDIQKPKTIARFIGRYAVDGLRD
jgi:AcrR family transcriptional regulator